MKVQGAIWPCNSRGYSHAELQVNASLTSTEALHLMSEKLEEVLNLLCDCNSFLVGGGWLRIWWFYRFQYQESRKDLSFLIYIVNHQSGSFPKGMLTRSALAAVLPTQHGHLSHLLPGAGFKMMRLHKGNSSRAFKKKRTEEIKILSPFHSTADALQSNRHHLNQVTDSPGSQVAHRQMGIILIIPPKVIVESKWVKCLKQCPTTC